jgi:hypothetical protein
MTVANHSSAAETPSAEQIVAQMKAALQPPPASTRRWEMRMSSPRAATPRVVEALQARKKIGDGGRVVTVVTAPPSLRGMTFMLDEADEVRWIYAPTIDRVRKIGPVLAAEAYLHSDFSYGDLGWISTGAKYRLLGRETRDGVSAYQIEEQPSSPWFYSRILTWVATDTFLPVRRELYDPGGQLWKVETFSDVRRIEDLPTPTRIRMEDVLAKTSTEIIVSDVDYEPNLPDALFDPMKLSEAIASPAFEVARGESERAADAP